MHTYIYRIAPENGKLTAARRAGLYNPEIKGVLYPENGGRVRVTTEEGGRKTEREG